MTARRTGWSKNNCPNSDKLYPNAEQQIEFSLAHVKKAPQTTTPGNGDNKDQTATVHNEKATVQNTEQTPNYAQKPDFVFRPLARASRSSPSHREGQDDGHEKRSPS